MTLLAVEALSKHYPVGRRRWFGFAPPSSHRLALDDVSFTLGRGEALGVVGPSGSGKSTLAGLLARLHDPTAGVIRFEGVDIAAVPASRAARAPWRAAIQMVAQDPQGSLDPRWTIRRSVAAPLLRLEKLRGAALERRVAEALERVRLGTALGDRLPHQLSGGELARAGIARAVALRPRILILDEPTAALDVSIQLSILQLLDELRRDGDLATVFVSHDIDVVRMVCDRVLVMQAGRIVEQGRVESVFDRPIHPTTAELLAAVPRLDRTDARSPMP